MGSIRMANLSDDIKKVIQSTIKQADDILKRGGLFSNFSANLTYNKAEKIAQTAQKGSNLRSRILDDTGKEVIENASQEVTEQAQKVRQGIKNTKAFKGKNALGFSDSYIATDIQYNNGTTRRMYDINGKNVTEDAFLDAVYKKDNGEFVIQDGNRQLNDGIQIDTDLTGIDDEYTEKIAGNISRTGVGDNDGGILNNMSALMQQHPLGTALAGAGVGVVGTNILDDD